jgi:hypothetical protein
MWGHAGSVWLWTMEQDQLADASYYKGSLRVDAAYDNSIVGTVFRGFYEYRRTSPHLSQYLQFQRCVNDVDTEWFCLHGTDCVLETSFLQLTGPIIVPTGHSMVVLEGQLQARLTEGVITAAAMTHLKPRERPVEVAGNAKAFLIRSAGPLQSVEAPSQTIPTVGLF